MTTATATSSTAPATAKAASAAARGASAAASVRPAVRMVAAGAGLVGVLALSACSGGGDSGGASAAPSDTTSAASSAGTGSGSATGSSDALQGSWITTSGGKIVALVVTGKQAGLFETGGGVCSGTAGEEAGMRMIRLSCTNKSKERVTGMVDSVSKSSMEVTWSGKTGAETYTKAEGGKLPSGLSTAGQAR